MIKVLFCWPPQLYYYGSLFKHFTYFGETINYIRNNVDCEMRVIDAGVDLYSIKEIIKNINWADKLVLYIEPYTIEIAIKLSKLAKKAHPNIQIIAYGTACCYIPQYLLKEGKFEAIVKTGFWEESIKDFIEDELEINKRGQVFTQNGTIGVIKKIATDKWGFPDLELLPIETYYAISGRRQLEICVNKGCPYPCSFCTEKTVYGNIDIRRNVDNIIMFIENSHKICDTYYFDSTTFTLNKHWVEELCEKIISLPYAIKWRTVTRLDSLDEELIMLMSKAGCYKISIGIETLKQTTQDCINKIIDNAVMVNVFSILKKHGIIPRALIIIGLPNQDEEEIQTTYDILESLDVEIRSKEYCPYNDVMTENIDIETVRGLDRTECLITTPYIKFGSENYITKLYLSKDE